MNKNHTIKVLDWNSYHICIDHLALKIPHNKYKYIVGLDPDDMLVAVHLSHRLSTISVTDINFLSLLIGFGDIEGQVLVVKNIVQTGNSFNQIMEQTKCNFDTAVLFKDKESKFNPTYYISIPEERIYFPWQKCGLDLKEKQEINQ